MQEVKEAHEPLESQELFILQKNQDVTLIDTLRHVYAYMEKKQNNLNKKKIQKSFELG
jgi:hypothetical protein